MRMSLKNNLKSLDRCMLLSRSVGITRFTGDLLWICNFVKTKFSEVVILKLFVELLPPGTF